MAQTVEQVAQAVGRETASPGGGRAHEVLRRWQKLSGKPFGKLLFSIGVGRMARYTGSIRPRVHELRPGYARVRMHDRPALRNHLQSVHAIALMNLAEVTSGLAMLAGMPADARAIITNLAIEFKKKARGTLEAECTTAPPQSNEKHEYLLEAIVRDTAGEEVARATARWLVGPR
ncbi:MAG TPA: hotdog fold domain-containing protein [Thermoanaerobaculia bacterium]|jgi:acyl-coenzyme A thioesterase PaaI-like protein|nr:hotdog fold domain-containing protein [Thermoanaerobaculia bacterium]